MHFSYASLDVESDASPESTCEDEKSEPKSNTSKEVQGARRVVPLSRKDSISQTIRTDTQQGSNIKEEVNEQSIHDTDANDANQVLKQNQKSFLQNIRSITEKRCGTKELSSLTIQQQLAAIGCKEISVTPDGNCFFRAVSHQLYGDELQHSNIRSATTNYLNSRKDAFAPFIDESVDRTIDSYIKRMEKETTYADHLVILATATFFNKDIIIHEEAKRPLLIASSNSRTDQQWHVLYNPNREHYDIVISSENNLLPFLSAEQVLIT